MITEDEATYSMLLDDIDEALRAALKNKKEFTLSDIREAFLRILTRWGVSPAGDKNNPCRWGKIDQHHGRPVLLCATPGGLLIRPLRVGESIDLIGDDHTLQRVEIVEDDAGHPRLDVPEDMPVIGMHASASALLPGTEHIAIGTDGRIVSAALAEGKEAQK